MTPVVWVSIILAVVIVSAAVGIPYWHTHRNMNDHYEHDHSEKYLEATGRSPEDVSSGRAGRPWRRKRATTATARRSGTDRSAGTGTL